MTPDERKLLLETAQSLTALIENLASGGVYGSYQSIAQTHYARVGELLVRMVRQSQSEGPSNG